MALILSAIPVPFLGSSFGFSSFLGGSLILFILSAILPGFFGSSFASSFLSFLFVVPASNILALFAISPDFTLLFFVSSFFLSFELSLGLFASLLNILVFDIISIFGASSLFVLAELSSFFSFLPANIFILSAKLALFSVLFSSFFSSFFFSPVSANIFALLATWASFLTSGGFLSSFFSALFSNIFSLLCN